MTPAVLELTDVSKDYRGLRPLRIERLIVQPGELVAMLGLDLPASEVFVNLVTGATLPDRGDVKVFGRSTADIRDSADWLALVDRFGILSERAVLIDHLSTIQNLSLPFTLEIEPPAPDVAARAVALAREVGLPEASWTRAVGDVGLAGRARIRLGRALALDPAALLVEHINASVPPAELASFGRDLQAVASNRRASLVALTGDVPFAERVAARVLRLDPATGRLGDDRRGWFRRRLS